MKKLIAAATLVALTACGPNVIYPEPVPGPKGDTGAVGPKGDVGEQGPQGDPGQDAELETVELCPNIPGDGFHEYLLRTSTAVFGVYSHGSRIFLTKLLPNTDYVTTDGRSCHFRLNHDLSISY